MKKRKNIVFNPLGVIHCTTIEMGKLGSIKPNKNNGFKREFKYQPNSNIGYIKCLVIGEKSQLASSRRLRWVS